MVIQYPFASITAALHAQITCFISSWYLRKRTEWKRNNITLHAHKRRCDYFRDFVPSFLFSLLSFSPKYPEKEVNSIKNVQRLQISFSLKPKQAILVCEDFDLERLIRNMIAVLPEGLVIPANRPPIMIVGGSIKSNIHID
ncbi:hypothetical protein BCON_0078g00100 [Botryotinia convoluta]|uniref:Uncharacterized protein n=1 Tax=Botryotinia convoluta TaxID=54673 RepID=A0A4Z1I483_9HELO|nr:hypothetical protein BCON_0078g00100 [Botryotinia convoluta]